MPKANAKEPRSKTSASKSNGRRRNDHGANEQDGPPDSDSDAQALFNYISNKKHLLQLVRNEVEQEKRRTRHRQTRARTPPPAVDTSRDIDENEDEDVTGGKDNFFEQDSDEYRNHDTDSDESSASGTGGRHAGRRQGPRTDGSTGSDEERRKRSSFPTVSVGRTTQLSKPLPMPRSSSHAPSATATSQGAAPSSPAPAQNAPPQSTAPPGDAPVQATNATAGQATNAPVTPYKRVANPKKKNETLEGSHSPISRDIIEHLKPPFRVFVATEAPFPNLKKTTSWATPLIKTALQAGEAGRKKRIVRADDPQYMEDICRLIHTKAAQLRNHVLTVAKRVVADDFLAPWAGLPARTRAKKVKTQLLDHRAFIYADTNARTGMFENSSIRKIIQRSFFTSASHAFNLARHEEHSQAFKPYSLPLIALACTAIRCALDGWTTVEPTNPDFTSAVYAPIYDKFRKLLDVLIEGDDEAAAFLEMRTAWYKDAWEATGVADCDDDDAAASSDDEEVLARNRAALRASRAARQAEQQQGSD